MKGFPVPYFEELSRQVYCKTRVLFVIVAIREYNHLDTVDTKKSCTTLSTLYLGNYGTIVY